MEDEKFIDEIKSKIDEKIKEFNATDINPNNLDSLYKLVDIKKDLANIDYWKKKGEKYEIRSIQWLWKL